MKNLSWFQARDLALAGHAIRRDAWTRWITRGPSLWFTSATADDGSPIYHVVTMTEFTTAEFLAQDWTDESWNTAVPPSVPGSGPVTLPPSAASPTITVHPSSSASPDDTAAVSSSPSGPSGPTPAPSATPTTPPVVGGGGRTFGSVSNPPDPSSLFQPSTGVTPGRGGGGGIPPGPGSDTPKDTKPHPAGPAAPTVSIEIQPPSPDRLSGACAGFTGRTYDATLGFVDADHSGPMTLAALELNVSISGGPIGLGLLSLSGPGTAPSGGTIGPGMAKGYEFTAIPFTPGSTITITASYSINGVVYTGSGSYTFPTWSDWVLPTKIVLGTVGGMFSADSTGASGTIAINGHTSGTDAHTLTATCDKNDFTLASLPTIATTAPIIPGDFAAFQFALNPLVGPPHPSWTINLAVSYEYLGKTLSGNVTIHSTGVATATGDILAP